MSAPGIKRVIGQVARVLEGGELTVDELAELMAIEPCTAQADALAHAAHILAVRGNGGRGYLYGQIGLDAGPCAGNCQFCAFALCNAGAGPLRAAPLADAVHYARLFAEEGVHLISVMSSAGYPFSEYLEAIRQIRGAIGPDVRIMANTGDLGAEQCEQLRDAGADSLYHAVRLGEGAITAIPERRRWETIANARAAGLAVSTAVEPLYQAPADGSLPVQEPHAIAKRMLEVVACEPFCAGVGSLCAVEGTAMAEVRPWPDEKMRVFGNVFQLAARGQVPFGGDGSIMWVDAGLDPRGRGYSSADADLRRRIVRARAELEARGWNVPARADGAL